MATLWLRGGQRKLAKTLRLFRVSHRGATAIEFALVITPFLFVVFSLIEISLIFVASVTLQNAMATASRSLRVATASSATGISNHTSVNAFRSLVCSKMGWLQSQCNGYSDTSGLVIDVRNPGSFATGSPGASPITNGTLAQYGGSTCFYSGQAGGDIVVARAYYPWTLYLPFLNLAFPKLSNGQIVLSDTEVFKLEPNNNADSSGGSC